MNTQAAINEAMELQTELRTFASRIQLTTVINVVPSIYNEQGIELQGSYANNTINVSYQGVKKTASNHNIELEVAALLTLAHEAGHHMYKHQPQTRTMVEIAILEYEAWLAGRQIIQIFQDPAVMALYDTNNRDNIHTYCNLYGDCQEDAQLVFGKLSNKMMEVIGQ